MSFIMYDDFPPAPSDEPEPYWTAGRLLYFVVTLITLIAFLIYVFILPLIEANRRSQVESRATPTVLPRF